MKYIEEKFDWQAIGQHRPEGYYLADKGPWNDEPDKIQWIDEATGLPCLIVRNPMGALCGYVGVSSNHPYYEKEYSDLALKVHGGPTFSGKCQEDGHIFHLVEEGEDDNVWWIGFDCGHGGDVIPAFTSELFKKLGLTSFSGLRGETYKTVEYVKLQCEHLAQQLKEML